MKALKCILPLFAIISLVGCGGNTDSVVDDSSESTSTIPLGQDCTVKFWRDYAEYSNDRDPYYLSVNYRGELITDIPPNPTPLFAEFPVFKGWSTISITDDPSALTYWDFSKDKLPKTKTFDLFGIWDEERIPE